MSIPSSHLTAQLGTKEKKLFARLRTPQQIQNYLDTLAINYEKDGETHMSPRRVIQSQKAHCVEAAMFGAAALWVHGWEPLLMDFRTKPYDEDHVIAPFLQNGYWGALSKTNHAILRWRDPVYKTLRELAMSYFHEYIMYENGSKTLLSYSKPLNLKKFGTAWITEQEDSWYVDEALDAQKHFLVVPPKNKKLIRPADAFERSMEDVREWRKSNPRT